jgi:prevent-host-death family protein
MKEVAVSRFKAQCLALLAQVAETGEPILVTKRGKPVAQVLPPPAPATRRIFGCMRGTAKLSDADSLVPPALEPADWEPDPLVGRTTS